MSACPECSAAQPSANQGNEGDRPGEPVHAIEHVERVDCRHDEQNRQAVPEQPMEMD